MAVSNSLIQSRGGKPKTFSAFLTSDAIKHKINEMVGGRDGQRFITSIISAVSTNPALSECEHSTILSAAMLGESLKLSPSPQLGQYYMVPFKDKKRGCKVAQFQLGYKGYIQLAIRSGYYKKLNVLAIKQGELVRFDPLEEEIEVNLVENDTEREDLPTIGYYAMFEYQNGFKKAMYWSREKMMPTQTSTAWRSAPRRLRSSRRARSPKRTSGNIRPSGTRTSTVWLTRRCCGSSFPSGASCPSTCKRPWTETMGTINEDGSVDYVDNYPDEAPAPTEEPAPAPIVVDENTGEIIEEAPATADPTADFFNQEG